MNLILLETSKNGKKGWEIFHKIIGFDAAAPKDKHTHSRAHKGDSLCLFTQIMCCTCPSRGFVRIAQLFVYNNQLITQPNSDKMYMHAHTLSRYITISPSAAFWKMEKEELLFITFGLAYTFLRLLPWTATDCILKCLPVGSESRKKQCARSKHLINSKIKHPIYERVFTKWIVWTVFLF